MTKKSVTEETTTTTSSTSTFSIHKLTTDLRQGLSTLKQDLKSEQDDLFSYQDTRVDNLSQLENSHKNLENEHINDQVSLQQLGRIDTEIVSEYIIASDRFVQEGESLGRSITHVDQQIAELEPNVEQKKANRAGLQEQLDNDQSEDKNLSDVATNLRKDNEEQRTNIETNLESLKNEGGDKVDIFNLHVDLVTTYNQLVIEYEKILKDAELARSQAEKESYQILSEMSTENSQSKHLKHAIKSTDRKVNSRQLDIDALR